MFQQDISVAKGIMGNLLCISISFFWNVDFFKLQFLMRYGLMAQTNKLSCSKTWVTGSSMFHDNLCLVHRALAKVFNALTVCETVYLKLPWYPSFPCCRSYLLGDTSMVKEVILFVYIIFTTG